MASIFTRIVQGEIPSYRVAETDRFYAFLDINPLVPGHTLVIPKQETDYLFDINDQDYQDLMLFAKRVSEAIYKAIPCKRVGVAVLGMEVPHAHIHLVPLQSEGDLDFRKEKAKLTPEQFQEIAASIAKSLEV
ncbi:MAG: HIT family protein [Bacteroidales bacterium]|nr:HIT family protein [Bacteroidales bacterium]